MESVTAGERTVEAFSAVGYWWLEENESQQVTGDLAYDPSSGFSLLLHGLFGSLEKLNAEQRDPLTIFGITSDGKFISLYDCLTRGTRISAPGFPTESYSCSHALIGPTHRADGARVFKRCYVELSLLADWMQESPLRQTLAFKDEKHLTGVTVAYSRPRQQHFSTPLGTVTFANGLKTSGNLVHGMTLSPSPNIRVVLTEASTYEEALTQAVIPLRNLLCLGLSSPVRLDSVEFAETKRAKKGESRLKYYFAGAAESVEIPEARLRPWMLFSMADLPDRDSYSRWISASESIREVMNLVFGIIHSADFYLDLRFLAAVQALEVFHRRRFASLEMPQATYDKRVVTVRESVTAGLRKWVVHKLRGNNTKPLKQRMSEVYSHVAPVMDELVGSREAFLDDLRNTRNYYTHRDDSSVRTYAEGSDLYDLFQAAMTMLKACLLREAGFSAERCRDLFMSNQDFLWLRRRLKSHWTSSKPASTR